MNPHKNPYIITVNSPVVPPTFSKSGDVLCLHVLEFGAAANG